MRLKKYKEKKKFSYYIFRGIIIIIISFILSNILIHYLSIKTNEILMPLAESSVRKYISTIINNSTEQIKFDNDLFSINKDNDEIKMITYNTFEATKLINTITQNIQDNFTNLENNNKDESKDFIVEEISSGVMFENSLIRNLGPKIKIRTDIVGDVLSELRTEVKPYGINNALVEVTVHLEANARVILPFVSKEIQITNDIPISINIVNGNIPNYYLSTYK